MSKFDRVLSDDWLPLQFKSGNEIPVLQRMINQEAVKDIVKQVEQAVLAKLAEQEPVAYAAFSNNGNIRLWSARPQMGYGEVDLSPIYAHPMPSNCQGIIDSSNLIPDGGKMVADMYWINPDYPSYTSILDAFDPIQSGIEVEIGDRFEVSRAKTLQTLTIEVTELEENGDVKDYKVLSGDHFVGANKMVSSDHIPDIGQMIPEGWQLVPKQVCGDMWDAMNRTHQSPVAIYHAALVSAPKYTGDN